MKKHHRTAVSEALIAKLHAAIDTPDGASVTEMRAMTGMSDQTVWKWLNVLRSEKRAHHRLVAIGGPAGTLGRWFANELHADEWQRLTLAAKPPPKKRVYVHKPQPKKVRPEVKKKAGADLIVKAKPAKDAPVRTSAGGLRGDAVTTARTRYTIDTAQRPNARWQAAPDLPPDPRWPSFASEWKQLRGKA